MAGAAARHSHGSIMAFSLDSEQQRQLDALLSRYPNKQAACIPVLHLCQSANDSWISEEVIQFVSERLGLSTAHVKGVATFYSLLNIRPVGKHQVWVCRTLSCALRGSGSLLQQCESKLAIRAGETTPDGRVTLRTAECLASCGTAPVMQVDDQFHENLTPEDVDRILDGLIKGD